MFIFLFALLSLFNISEAQKMKGMVFTSWSSSGYSTSTSKLQLSRVAATGTKYVEIVVTWYQSYGSSTNIQRTSSTPTDASIIAAISNAKALGMVPVLKPHVDCLDGTWRGFIGKSFTNQQWSSWFASYKSFISVYASISQKYGLPLFKFGTELEGTYDRASDWNTIINNIRSLYTGKLTYGANWDGVDRVPFWNKVDYIGVDAYYYLGDAKTTPTLTSIKQAWSPRISALSSLSSSTGKQILFAEIGYASSSIAAVEPWSYNQGTPDPALQALLYQAFFEAVWNQPWLAGAFFWAWAADNSGSPCDTYYGIYGKPALNILTAAYKGTSFSSSGPIYSSTKSPVVFYANGNIGSGMSDWSYSTTLTKSSSTNACPGSSSSALAKISAWGAVSIASSSPVSLSGYTHLTIDIISTSGQPSAPVEIWFCADTDCATTYPKVSYAQYVDSCGFPTSWGSRRVRIPLTDLTGKSAYGSISVKRIQIGSNSGVTIRFDNVRLIADTVTVRTSSSIPSGALAAIAPGDVDAMLATLSTAVSITVANVTKVVEIACPILNSLAEKAAADLTQVSLSAISLNGNTMDANLYDAIVSVCSMDNIPNVGLISSLQASGTVNFNIEIQKPLDGTNTVFDRDIIVNLLYNMSPDDIAAILDAATNAGIIINDVQRSVIIPETVYAAVAEASSVVTSETLPLELMPEDPNVIIYYGNDNTGTGNTSAGNDSGSDNTAAIAGAVGSVAALAVVGIMAYVYTIRKADTEKVSKKKNINKNNEKWASTTTVNTSTPSEEVPVNVRSSFPAVPLATRGVETVDKVSQNPLRNNAKVNA